MLKKYTVGLTNDEEKALIELVTRGTAKARAIQRAHILLLAGEGKIDTEIAEMVRCHQESVTKVRRRFKERGGGESLNDRPRPGAKRKLDGEAEARLVAVACSAAPADRSHWTMQQLADQLVTIGVVNTISDETVRRVLTNRRSSCGRRDSGVSAR